MPTRRQTIALLATLFSAPAALAQDKPEQSREQARAEPDKLRIIATFSILGDVVKNVGGERVEVAMLVGPNADAHVYSPSPADAKKIADAKVVAVNGLGYEGWIERLVKASGSKAPVVVATKGVKPRKTSGGHGHGHSHDHAASDPHAW